MSYLATNISRSQLKAETIMKIYKIRWQIELSFKHLKSGNNLRGVNTTKENILLVMACASLCAYFCKALVTMALGVWLERPSAYKVNVRCQDWFADFVHYLVARDIEKLRTLLRRLCINDEVYSMSVQSTRKRLELKTLESTMLSIIQDIVAMRAETSLPAA